MTTALLLAAAAVIFGFVVLALRAPSPPPWAGAQTFPRIPPEQIDDPGDMSVDAHYDGRTR